MMVSNILEYFPLEKIRQSQEIVLKEVNDVFAEGKSLVILEAPVGSGKSAIAVALARAVGNIKEEGVGGAHILTPRKSLQDQYFEDFSKYISLMKGRAAYPCTIDAPPRQYVAIQKAIKEGRVTPPGHGVDSCGDGPCKNNTEIYNLCTNDRPCPYNLAMDIALQSDIVVHNLHSFIFQSSFSGKFNKRELLIIDEAHEIEATIRDFISKKIILKTFFSEDKIRELKTLDDWKTFLLSEALVPVETDKDRNLKLNDKTYKSQKDEYLEKVAYITSSDRFTAGFSVNYTAIQPWPPSPVNKTPYIELEFVPHHIGSAARSMLFDYGTKVLLMSGTIYNKDVFCKNLGINPKLAHFIRVGSSFPAENRPIYLKPKYQVNTSHAKWVENFPELIEKINSISEIFKKEKGLIHAPSYVAAEQLKNGLNNPRIITHNQLDFQNKLEEFYLRQDNAIFVSPVCQQGVDFKDSRARFQIIIRVPYQSTASKFVEDKVKEDFPWYNHQALTVFGQQLGRVNRSENDYGATFLIDDRFNSFISRNSKLLPKWVKDAMIWK